MICLNCDKIMQDDGLRFYLATEDPPENGNFWTAVWICQECVDDNKGVPLSERVKTDTVRPEGLTFCKAVSNSRAKFGYDEFYGSWFATSWDVVKKRMPNVAAYFCEEAVD